MLESTGSQKAGHDLVTEKHLKRLWRLQNMLWGGGGSVGLLCVDR